MAYPHLHLGVELFLNALWLAIALAATALWLTSRTTARTRRKTVAGAVALACIAILLFPVISATDDLHAMQAAAEEPNTGKKLDAHSATHPALPAASSDCTVAILPVHSYLVHTESVSPYSHLATTTVYNRPPPRLAA